MSEPRPKRLSRRDALMTIAGAGAGLAVAGTAERNIFTPNIEAEIKRRQFNEFTSIVNARTNLDMFYPGRFASVTDEQLMGLFVKRSLTNPDTRNTRTFYELSIPRQSPSEAGIPGRSDFQPAIEVMVDTYSAQPTEPHIVKIVSHFYTTDAPAGKQLSLFNYDPQEPPKLEMLKTEDLRANVGLLFKDPDIPIMDDWSQFGTVSTKKPQGEDIYQYQKDFASEDNRQVVSLALEEDGTCVYYEVNFNNQI